MTYDVDAHLLDTQTGERRVYHTSGSDYDEGGFAEFIWSEGNFACDCNRFLFFERAAGREPGHDEGPCGEGRYLVEKIVRVSDGATIYTEVK